MDNELKPCPFCGSTVEVCVLMGCAHISCKNCDISFKSNTTGIYVDKQIEKWNTRAPTDIANYKARIAKLELQKQQLISELEKFLPDGDGGTFDYNEGSQYMGDNVAIAIQSAKEE